MLGRTCWHVKGTCQNSQNISQNCIASQDCLWRDGVMVTFAKASSMPEGCRVFPKCACRLRCCCRINHRAYTCRVNGAYCAIKAGHIVFDGCSLNTSGRFARIRSWPWLELVSHQQQLYRDYKASRAVQFYMSRSVVLSCGTAKTEVTSTEVVHFE